MVIVQYAVIQKQKNYKTSVGCFIILLKMRRERDVSEEKKGNKGE